MLENLGPDRQLVRLTTGEHAGMELVLVGRAPPGVQRLEDFLGEAATPVDGRLPPRLAAERLLCSLLEESQLADWKRTGTFWVTTDFGRVQLGRLFNLAFEPRQGEPLWLCVVPAGFTTLPEADIWVNLLLVLRSNPRWFFTVANWRRRRGEWMFGPVPLAAPAQPAGARGSGPTAAAGRRGAAAVDRPGGRTRTAAPV